MADPFVRVGQGQISPYHDGLDTWKTILRLYHATDGKLGYQLRSVYAGDPDLNDADADSTAYTITHLRIYVSLWYTHLNLASTFYAFTDRLMAARFRLRKNVSGGGWVDALDAATGYTDMLPSSLASWHVHPIEFEVAPPLGLPDPMPRGTSAPMLGKFYNEQHQCVTYSRFLVWGGLLPAPIAVASGTAFQVEAKTTGEITGPPIQRWGFEYDITMEGTRG